MFEIRFQEHLRTVRHENPDSSNNYSFSLANLKILHIVNRRLKLDFLE